MEPFIGQITMFAGTFPPRGWAFCDGQLLAISQNQALFSLLGTIYGGDGRTTFGLPALRGRVAIHAGNGPGLPSFNQGQKSGSETTTLNQLNLPAHTHAATVSGTVDLPVNDGGGDTASPIGAFYAEASEDNYAGSADAASGDLSASLTAAVGNTGGSQAYNNIQPSQGINYIIALTGVFPSRS